MAELTSSTREAARRLGVSDTTMHKAERTGRTACDAEGKLDLYGPQALAMRAVVESGKCFIRLLTVPTSPRNPIGLSLQVLESDHLDTARQGVIEGVPMLQGIGLGEAGEPVGYWLHRVHPGAAARSSCSTPRNKSRHLPRPARHVAGGGDAKIPPAHPGRSFARGICSNPGDTGLKRP